MSTEQRIRAFLFYLSVIVFFAGLPFILSFALGYKFNPRNFRFTKTGSIVIKTQPQGASVYFDNKLWDEKTPVTFSEILPGNFNIRLQLPEHYPWASEVNVEAGNVTYLERIILFPLRSNIKQLNKADISSFWIDKDKEKIYYINHEKNSIYKSDLEGENFKELVQLPEMSYPVKELKVSPDKEKLLCYSQHKIAIVYLVAGQDQISSTLPVILDFPDRKIIDVFWHSDSYHLVLVTNKAIEVQEARLESSPVLLVSLGQKNISAVYDGDKDVLYFIDSQKAADGKFYDNMYKLNLGSRFSPFSDLIKLKPNE